MGYSFGETVDWKANPFGVQEWTHFLNRHHFLRQLLVEAVFRGDAMERQGTESPTEVFVANPLALKPSPLAGEGRVMGKSTRGQNPQVRPSPGQSGPSPASLFAKTEEFISDWIVSNPVPVDSNGGAGPAWETLSAAWRLREWLLLTKYAWRDLTEEFKRLFLRSVWEHARHLNDHQGHPNNWIIVESAALTIAGLRFPEFNDALTWVETGLTRLQAAIREQFFSDGAHFELSPMYHAISLEALLDVIHALRAAGRNDSVALEKTAEKGAVFLRCLRRPDGTWPSTNDSGSYIGDYSALLSYAVEVLSFRNPLVTASFREHEPKPLSVFPDAGIAILRSGTGSAAHQLMFRAGPAGASHVHNDILSLELSAHGRRVW